jgi:hypothetical protein
MNDTDCGMIGRILSLTYMNGVRDKRIVYLVGDLPGNCGKKK